MRGIVAVLAGAFALLNCAQPAAQPQHRVSTTDPCLRFEPGSAIADPSERVSENGVLKLSLTMRNARDKNGHMRYCYVDELGNQAPTLRVRPGDTLIVSLRNEISLLRAAASNKTQARDAANKPPHNDCSGGTMGPELTNLHFHGLSVPPTCHQDETLNTLIAPGDPPFEYRLTIPKNQPPGLYWYHPHVHGYTEEQVLGGASGAIIVEGIGSVVPRVVGLAERVFIVRDEQMPEASKAERADANRPTKQITVNSIPVPYPAYPAPVVEMKPQERELWRVVNASADTFLALTVDFGGKRQKVGLVALDGVPIHYGMPGAATYSPDTTEIILSPAGRAEFIMTAPAGGQTGVLRTEAVYRGAGDDDGPIKPVQAEPGVRTGLDDVDAARPLVRILASMNGTATRHRVLASAPLDQSFADLSSTRPTGTRKLFFSERLSDPKNPKSPTLFFITEDGETPAAFGHNTKPIIVHEGAVEDWTIENRSKEAHTFHVHQLHFLVLGSRGLGWEEITPRDTVNLPAWAGFGRYPSVTVRMDFRDANIVGTVPFHCHILQHADGGMMGAIKIEAAGRISAATK